MTTYPNTGTCSRSVSIEIDDAGNLAACSFAGGCPGNTAGVAKLAVGRPAAEVAAMLKGTPCGNRGTSCPDQLARAIETELAKRDRRSGFSMVIPIALLLALAVFGFAVYRYRLLHHLPVISDIPALADIPALSSFPDAGPELFPVASEPPYLAPAAPGFGPVQWQYSPGEVRAAEAVPPFRTSPTAIVYSLDILNQPCMLTYFFRREQLYGAQFQFSAPGSAFLPALTAQQAQKLYDRLKAQLDARYGQATETTTSHPRADTADLDLRLQDARRQLDDRSARLRDTPGDGPDAAKRAEAELEEARRRLAAIEAELRAAEAADRDNPLLSRLNSKWTSGPMSISLVADLTTTPPGIEIHYRASLPRRPAQIPGRL